MVEGTYETEGGDLPYYFQGLFDNSHGQMGAIVDQPGYIVLRHLGKLLLEYAFEPRKDDKALALIVVVDHPELNLAIALFDHCWL